MKLVPFNEKVFSALYDWHMDEDTRKSMGGMSVPLTRDELYAEYTLFLTGKSRIYAVELDDGRIAGCFMAENIHIRHKRLDCHIVFGKGFERFVKDGCTLFLDHMFNENRFEYLNSIIPATNAAVKNLLEKMGCVKRTSIPEYFNFSDGVCAGDFYSLKKSKRRF